MRVRKRECEKIVKVGRVFIGKKCWKNRLNVEKGWIMKKEIKWWKKRLNLRTNEAVINYTTAGFNKIANYSWGLLRNFHILLRYFVRKAIHKTWSTWPIILMSNHITTTLLLTLFLVNTPQFIYCRIQCIQCDSGFHRDVWLDLNDGLMSL